MEDRNKIFQELKNYEQTPPAHIWTGLEQKLNVSKQGSFSMSKNWTIGVISVTVVAVITTLTIILLPKKQTPIQNVNTSEMVFNPELSIFPDNYKTFINPAAPYFNTTISKEETTVLSGEDSRQIIEPTVQQNKEIISPNNPQQDKNDNQQIINPSIIKTDTIKTVIPNVTTSKTENKNDSFNTVSVENPTNTEQHIDVELNQNKKICRGEKTFLNIHQGEDVVWSTGATSQIISVEPLETTRYQVSWKKGNQLCQSEITVEVLDCSIFVPNAFSPNGDGINDVFRPIGSDISAFQMLIFSISGELLFESKDITIGWDGMFGGEKMENGTYLYRISFVNAIEEKRSLQGVFNLIP